MRLQRAQAELAAAKIIRFFEEIEGQIGWTTQHPWSESTLEEWRFDLVRLLRQVPAITELAKLDGSGREQLRTSRLAPDVVGSQVDFSGEPKFLEAIAHGKYYGPVYFGRESEPYLTFAMAGKSRDAGVSVAELNLKLISDLVSQVKVGERGQAYIVDAQGRLIAHPNLSLVLRNTDLSQLAQVRAARAAGAATLPDEEQVAEDIQGRRVLATHTPIAPLGWLLFIELPVEEGYAFLYESTLRSGAHLLAALGLAALAGLFLARRMVVPIRAFQLGAARIGGGDLGQRISIKSGDELEALGDQFNRMASQLQESYATLERKVEERTHDLELANSAKSRFLAAASHDLRQPLHALGLFVAELRAQRQSSEGRRIVERIDAAVEAMNELFNALLDISKLDAGVLAPAPTDFPGREPARADRGHVRGGGAGKGIVVADRVEQRLRAQRFHSARADIAQFGRQRGALHDAMAAWSWAAAGGLSTCASRCGTAGPGFPRISDAMSSASSISLPGRNGIGMAGSASGWRSSIACADCSIIGSSCARSSAKDPASPCGSPLAAARAATEASRRELRSTCPPASSSS